MISCLNTRYWCEYFAKYFLTSSQVVGFQIEYIAYMAFNIMWNCIFWHILKTNLPDIVDDDCVHIGVRNSDELRHL